MIKQRDVEQITEDIQKIVDSGTDYIDALMTYGDKTGMEPEVLAEVVKKSKFLSSKIEKEAENLNIIEKSKKKRLTK